MNSKKLWIGCGVLAVCWCSVASIALADGACCFDSSCEDFVVGGDCTSNGGVFLDGESCASGACDPGACCSEGNCTVAPAYPCLQGGRTFGGAGTTCLDDPCGDGVGACCLEGACSVASPDDCDTLGGVWLGAGTNCVDDRCVMGACCTPGVCEVVPRYECLAVEGAFTADIDCAEGACEVETMCPTNALFTQQRDELNFFAAYLSEGVTEVNRYEDFAEIIGAVDAIRWYGLAIDPSAGEGENCVDSVDEFAINIYDDDNGSAGDLLCSHIVTPTASRPGVVYDVFDLVEYEAVLPEPCIVPRGWLSIQGLGDETCWFFWLSSNDQDRFHLCENCGGDFVEDSLAFCLLGDAGGVFGACCDEASGTCEDGVALADCGAAGSRFAADTLCDELDPPCESIIGACCVNDATCSVVGESECQGSDRVWNGGGTTCDICPARGACCIDEGQCFENVIEEECVGLGYTWAGEGTNCGDCFSLPDCPANSLFGQAPEGPTGFEAFAAEDSSAGIRWTRFSDLAGPIQSMTWWGFDLENIAGSNDFVECIESDNTFRVLIAEDAAGLPGEIVCDQTIEATNTPTGISYRGAAMNEYAADLRSDCVLQDGWVRIIGMGDPGCRFFWLSAETGETYCPTCAETFFRTGLALCLQGEEGGVTGSCCDTASAVCEESVDMATCVNGGGRFETGACDSLDPVCGEVRTPCCFGGTECAVLTQQECSDIGGESLGENATCFDCPCEIACPAWSIDEGEPICDATYVDDFNGGCDADPPVFSPIELCDTVCGTSGVTNSGLEFDWYELVVEEPTVIRWRARAEFPVGVAIVNGNFGCEGAPVLGGDFDSTCLEASVSEPVQPGTYYLVVFPNGATDGAECGAGYLARVSSSAGCFGDPDDDGDRALDDFASLPGCMTGPRGGVPKGCEVFDADERADVDLKDVSAFLLSFTGD